MRWIDWLMEYIQLNDRGEEFEDELEEDSYEEDNQSGPVFLERFRHMKQYPKEESFPMEITVKRASTLEDAVEICDLLINSTTVVINLETVWNGEQMRLMDFISGAVYSLNGSLIQVSNYIYIAAPEEVLLTSGDLQETDKEVVQPLKKVI